MLLVCGGLLVCGNIDHGIIAGAERRAVTVHQNIQHYYLHATTVGKETLRIITHNNKHTVSLSLV